MRLPSFILAAAMMVTPQLAKAEGPAPRIADVQVKRDSPDQPGIYHIKVTIEHGDTGWDDYVEAWEMFAPDGTLLGSRPFFGPELEEQATVSALAGVVIPQDVETVTIRARNFPQGLNGDPVEVRIPH